MCGGGDAPEVDTSFQDWTKEQSRKARQEEKFRQQRVSEGMRRIEAIFEGGTYRPVVAARGRYNPDGRYFTKAGKRWEPLKPVQLGKPGSGPRPGAEPSVPYKTTKKGRYYRAPSGEVIFESTVAPGRWFDLGKNESWDDYDEIDGAPGWFVSSAPEGGASAPYKVTKKGRYYRGTDGKVYFESTVAPGRWFDLGTSGEWDSWRELDAAPNLATLGAGPGPRAQFREARDGLFMRGRGKTYAGMDPLLAEREKALRGYYLPQVRENFRDARDELTFALARAGLSASTAANEKRSKLKQGFRRERAGVLSDIERDLSGTKSRIEDARTAIESQLRSSADTTAATDAALRSREVFADDAPELNPLTNTLLGFAQGIGQLRQGFQVGNIKRTAAGGGFPDQSRIIS